MPQHKLISFVVPVFNEEDMIDIFLAKVRPLLDNEPYAFEFVFVNDGSRDNTFAKLMAARAQDPRIRIVDFSRNFGKELALAAGLGSARGDAVIPMDVDLQDPPELIAAFLRKWEEGYDMVTGVRALRDSDTFFKRLSAKWFYHIFKLLSTNDLIPNAGDFRLLDRRVVDQLLLLPERNRFMKGLFSWVGFKTEYVYFERKERRFGTTKWNYWKLLNFALDGITSFSTVPLRVWSIAGLSIAAFAFLCALWIIARTMLFGDPVRGFPSLMVGMLFLGGLQLLGIGIIGEYLGRMYHEVKQRPLYIVHHEINPNPDRPHA